MKLRELNLTGIFKFFLVFLCCLPLVSCGKQNVTFSDTGFYFDTVITITLYDGGNKEILEECFSMAKTYENRFSKTIEGSDIWNINHGNGQEVNVHEDTIELLETALEYARLSDGKIDPTIGAVSKLWDFSDGNSAVIPSDEQLREALSHVDYRKLLLTEHSVLLSDAKAEIDLGFIAKGYIADKLKEYLISQNVTSAIINLGGNVLTIGSKPDGTPFQVGIQQPFAAAGTTALVLPVTNQSAVSSGNYERYFTKNNQIYHHILDTATGCPALTDLSSVTILSAASVDGDALSTTCFLLGSTEGMALIESLKNIEAVFIQSDGTILYSSGLQALE